MEGSQNSDKELYEIKKELEETKKQLEETKKKLDISENQTFMFRNKFKRAIRERNTYKYY